MHEHFIQLLGRILGGRYRLERLLGTGGFGGVFGAEDAILSRAVAVKVLAPSAIPDTQVRRFRREAQLLARIQHPNVVQVLDFGEEDGLIFIVMELLEGQTLGTVLEQCFPLPPRRIVGLGGQVLAGLGEAHARGIVHRDLKPDNILVCPQRDLSELVKVVDFGTAILLEGGGNPQTVEQLVTGTPAYMSPEHCRELPLDPRSDLYSFGCILYQMLCGRPPFMATSALDLMMAQIGRPPTPPSEQLKRGIVPRTLERIALWCLAKAPGDRPTSAGLLREELERALAGNTGGESSPLGVPEAVSSPVPSAGSAGSEAEAGLVGVRGVLLDDGTPELRPVRAQLEALGLALRVVTELGEGWSDPGVRVLWVPFDAQRLRQWVVQANAVRCPVLVCGSEDDLAAMARSVELGAHDYLALPVNPLDLRRRVTRALKLRRTL